MTAALQIRPARSGRMPRSDPKNHAKPDRKTTAG